MLINTACVRHRRCVSVCVHARFTLKQQYKHTHTVNRRYQQLLYTKSQITFCLCAMHIERSYNYENETGRPGLYDYAYVYVSEIALAYDSHRRTYE